MSQSAGNDGRSDAPTKDEERPEPTTFTLSVISPSTEIASPLTFPHLLASTTVQELKAKIRDVVPSNPDNNSQRLIHRGRMLGDAQTMLQIFGESLSNLDVQVLHLVLRPPLSDSAPANTNAANPVLSPHQRARLQSSTTTQESSRIGPTPSAIQNTQGVQSPQQLQQRLQQYHDLHHAEHSHNVMTQRLHQLQRETERLQQEIEAGARGFNQLGRLMNNVAAQTPTAPSVTRNPFQPPNGQGRTSLQQLILEQQQRRAAEGRQGAQDIGQLPTLPNGVDSGRSAPSFRNPERSTTYTREGVGPNGERWQVTVNETTTTIPVQQLQQRHNNNGGNGVQITANPAVDLQHMLRNVDRFMAPQNRQNGERRSSSNPPPARAEAHSPPTSTAARAGGSASASSSPPTTILNPTVNASAPNLGATPAAVSSSSSSPSVEPMVYILTSPSGPRALLINNSESFYTPRHSRYRYANNPPPPIHGQVPVGLPEYRNRNVRAIRREGRMRANEDAAVNLAQAHNQNARPGVPVVLRLFNLLWLIVRLAGFVWFFTSGYSSWSRLFLISGLALVIFFINTGIFNGPFNTIVVQLLGPVRRYLENLIPLAGPDAALVPAANAEVVRPAPAPETGHQPQPRLRRGELDENQVAARLVEEQRRRRAQGGWLVVQMRRAEHAALLFVASLIPGIGERHIAARDNAAREAEAAVERQRVEAENAANAANVENTGDAQTNNESTETEANQGENVDAQQVPPAEPVAAF